MHLIDSHCHLNFEGLSNRLPEVFANMEEQSVKQALKPMSRFTAP